MDTKLYEDRAIQTLKEQGLRITMPRLQVLRILAGSEKPMTAQGIFEKIRAEGDRIDLVSVYRILYMYVELHLVHHIGVVDGYVACQIDEAHGNWTEHFVCSKCGKVRELTVSPDMHKITEGHLGSMNLVAGQVKIEVLGTCC